MKTSNSVVNHKIRMTTAALVLCFGHAAQAQPTNATQATEVPGTDDLEAIDAYVQAHPTLFAGVVVDEPAGEVHVIVAPAGKSDATWQQGLTKHLNSPSATQKRDHNFVVKTRNAAHAIAELQPVFDSVNADHSWVSAQGSAVHGYYVDYITNSVTMEVDKITKKLSAYVKKHFGDLMILLETEQADVMFSRSDDSEPYWGGALLFEQLTPDTGSTCSSGFAVTLSNNSRGMLTAGHCFGLGHWAETFVSALPFGQAVVRQWDPNGGLDWEVLQGMTYDPSVYVGPQDSEVGTAVSGRTVPITGETACADGAQTGEVCGTVGPRNQCIQFKTNSQLTCHLSRSVNASKWITRKGDSGGPVFRRSGGKLYGVGMVVGGGDQATDGSTRSHTVYYHELSYILDPALMTLVTQ